MKILAVDDEDDVLDIVTYNLRAAGFQVITAHNGAIALKRARLELPDLVVLDLMMPELNGFELCRLLRSDPVTARARIIMLTARTDEVDRVLGLELGADDFLAKPFSPRELVLRAKKLLQHRRPPAMDGELLRFGDLELDIPGHSVHVNRRRVDLTATEFKLLVTLALGRGRVQTREFLLQTVWQYDESVESRTVDTHVRRLREKLGSAARHVETIRGVGYKFLDEKALSI